MGQGYFYQSFDVDPEVPLDYEIEIPPTEDLFITLQKTSIVSYGNSWWGRLALFLDGDEVASTSGSHDHILHLKDPTPGSYVIKVIAGQPGGGILRVQPDLPELPLGLWVVDTIYSSYGSVWYQVEVPPGQDTLFFEAEGMGLWSHFDIHLEQLWSSDRWASPVADEDRRTSLEIPNPAPGLYIIEFTDSAMIWSDQDLSDWSHDQERDVLIIIDLQGSIQPPPNYMPVISSISSNVGGNAGPVTIEITGGGFRPGAKVVLSRSGYDDINANTVVVQTAGRSISAMFDLVGEAPGEWTLKVVNPDGKVVTASGPFLIEEGGAPDLWIEVTGRAQVRANRPQTYVVRFGNRGNVDVEDAIVRIVTPAGMVCHEVNGQALSEPRDGRDLAFPIVVWIQNIIGSEENAFTIILSSSDSFDAGDVQVGILDITKRPQDTRSVTDILAEIFMDTVDTIHQESLENGGEVSRDAVLDRMGKTIGDQTSGALVDGAITGVLEYFVPGAGQLLIIKDFWKFQLLPLRMIVALIQLRNLWVYGVFSTTPEDKYGPTGYDQPDTPPDEMSRFTGTDRSFHYRIDYWNKEDAPAPAQDVLVVDHLDPNLDWDTFRFTEFGFLKWDVQLEPCQYFNVSVDLRPDLYLVVQVEGTFDVDTGEVRWVFRSLDPVSLSWPENPMAGFLPPINDTGYEIGWVGFSVHPDHGLPSGTRITNQAFVEFDWAGDLLDHPAPKEGPYVNTIDQDPPTSTITAEQGKGYKIELSWEGEDGNGSGIRWFSVYVDEDGEWIPLVVNTMNISYTFEGEPEHDYRFLCLATDNLGSSESIVEDGTNTVSITVEKEDGSTSLLLPVIVIIIIIVVIVATVIILRK
jgi:hypothetical protein